VWVKFHIVGILKSGGPSTNGETCLWQQMSTDPGHSMVIGSNFGKLPNCSIVGIL
jgi:hypothetical protein